MRPLPWYSDPEGMICHLRRSLYGPKQDPLAWFQRFASLVIVVGLSATAHDPTLCSRVTSW
jgi:hypothetical protein